MSLLAVFMFASLPFVQAGASDNAPSREVQGSVVGRSDAPLPDAIVYLKNNRTMAIKTFITGKDGRFRFPSLVHNVDYTIYAERKGKRSDTKTLSQFDSRSTSTINLHIEADE
jgi:hypothetical protein